ncbi:LuxR C-terminal-related transcriptional regulator [Lentzea sp. NPDC051213]|uniref:helix-turn-helix transcriptional regulator n=1 Tax=Lentzea sp. NPDC051213 TaxID=3364126 RepID=UPI003791642A
MQEELRGRHGELAALRAAFEAAASRGRLAVVRGEPGSGRSELLRHAAATWRAEGVAVVTHRPRSRAVVLIDDADRLPDPVLTATAMRMPGCLVVAVCADHAELAEAADVVIDLPTLSPDVVTAMITERNPLDVSVVEALRTALGPLYGNPGTVLATLSGTSLTWVGDRMFLAGDKISLPKHHPLLDHVRGLAHRVALLCVVRQGIEVSDLRLLHDDLADCGRALDELVENGVINDDLKVLCPALATAIIDQSGQDEVRRMHVALAVDTADPDLVALAGPDLPDAPRKARWLADRAVEIEATDPERAGRWLAAAVRMTAEPSGRLFLTALAVLVSTGQDELMRTVLSEQTREDPNTDAAAMLLLLNGEEPQIKGGPAVALARWWLGERPDWTPLPMNTHDDEVVITNAELNAIYHALRFDAQACRTALRYVRDDQARERFDELTEAGTAGDVATVLELVLGPRYRTPDHGPLKFFQRVVREYAKADWTAALQAVRQLELTKRPMPAHHLGRVFAAAIHSARGEHRQAFAWLAKVSRATRYAPIRAMVECGLLHRAGDSQSAVNLAWRTLRRARQAGVRPGIGRLMLQALQIALRSNDTTIARALMTEISELHRQDDCRCTLQILLLAKGLMYHDPAEAARGADVVRRRGHRPDLLWACAILAQFCDDPQPVVRELHAIAKEGGASFLLPARVSALMRRFGVTAPRASATPGELTGTELRIVELVRAGQTNRQIAAELEVSEKAVEHHLTRLFLRTGVRSRVELAAASLAGRLDDRGATG